MEPFFCTRQLRLVLTFKPTESNFQHKFMLLYKFCLVTVLVNLKIHRLRRSSGEGGLSSLLSALTKDPYRWWAGGITPDHTPPTHEWS